MCLLIFYVNPEAGADDLYLVLVNVRDEVFTRPTKLARFWENYPNVIGGRDDEPGKGGGTWLAMSKTGRIGALLNILQPDEEILPCKKGRGFLAADYVTDEKNYLNYLENIKEEGEKYNSFLLVTMDYSSLKEPKSAFYTNSSSQPPILLSPGIHAFGNSITPNTPWPKVSSAKEYFSRIVKKYPTISTKETLVKDLFSLLQDRTRYKLDESMKKQGKSKTDEFLSKLGAVYVHIPEFNYGSRCHTIILIDGKGSVDFYEKSRPEDLAPEVEGDWILNHHTFKLHGK